jgi:hypothetical protein
MQRCQWFATFLILFPYLRGEVQLGDSEIPQQFFKWSNSGRRKHNRWLLLKLIFLL